VITDIQLPHVSGLELIHQLKSDKKLAEIPIMAVTAYSATGDEERIRAAGAQAYVSKPISVVRFAQTVDELLEDASERQLKEDGLEDWANEGGDAPGVGEAGGEEEPS
jgi:two-component system cell cycle response regulator DivK